jgi:hypothetical protein
VVNVGRISEAAELGRFTEAEAALVEAPKGARGKQAPLTVNADMLRGAGLIGSARRPLKVLGNGEVGRALFVVADAFTRSAVEKLEAAGGTAQLIEVPTRPTDALRPEEGGDAAADHAATGDAATDGAGDSPVARARRTTVVTGGDAATVDLTEAEQAESQAEAAADVEATADNADTATAIADTAEARTTADAADTAADAGGPTVAPDEPTADADPDRGAAE